MLGGSGDYRSNMGLILRGLENVPVQSHRGIESLCQVRGIEDQNTFPLPAESPSKSGHR
jgi:hypothetical protein